MLNDNEQSIVYEITSWLETVPEPEDILYYVNHFPEDRKYLFFAAAEQLAQKLKAEKMFYCHEHDLLEFLQDFNEYDQFYALGWLAEFNPQSVLKRIRKEHADYPDKLFPDDAFKWARIYLAKFGALTYFMAATEYSNFAVYLDSFLDLPWDQTKLEGYYQSLKASWLDDAKREEREQDMGTVEKESMRQLLKQLEFLPSDFVERLLQDFVERQNTIERILQVASLLIEYKVEEARKDREAANVALQGQLRQMMENKLLLNFEYDRLDKYHPDREMIAMAKAVADVFQVTSLADRSLLKKLSSYVATLSEDTKAKFFRFLHNFLRAEPPQVAVVIAPLSMSRLLRSIMNMHDQATLKQFAVEQATFVANQETVDLFKNLLDDLFYISEEYFQKYLRENGGQQPSQPAVGSTMRPIAAPPLQSPSLEPAPLQTPEPVAAPTTGQFAMPAAATPPPVQPAVPAATPVPVVTQPSEPQSASTPISPQDV